MKFTVSVIIPVYNAAAYIENAVISAHRLAEVEEIILIEDRSSDGSLDVCHNIKLKFPKVKLYVNETNSGSAAARNIGLMLAACAYIAFLDADDEYLISRFEITQSAFKQFPSAFGVYEAIGVKYYNEEARKIFNYMHASELTTVTRPVAPKELFQALLTEEGFGWMSLVGFTMVNRKDGQMKLFDESLRQCQDTDFFYNLSLNENLIHGNLNQPVALRGIHDRNRTLFNTEERENSKKMLVEKWYSMMYSASFSSIINRKLIKDKISLNIDYSKSKSHIKFQIIVEFIKLTLIKPVIALKWFA